MKFPRVVRDLLAAREVLVRDGWTRGLAGMDEKGPCCVRGAIQRVTGTGWHTSAADFAEYVVPIGEGLLARWNDNYARDRGDVLALLGDAASLALSEAVRP